MPQKLRRTKTFTDTHPELPIDPDVVQPGVYKWPPHFQPLLVLYVFVGGCIGAYARYLVIQAFPTPTNGWPIATLSVNLLGAFALGFLLERLARFGKDQGSLRAMRLLIGTGFLGAFTTYSSFAVETSSFISSHHASEALWYVATTLIGGVVLAALGVQVAVKHHIYREKKA